MTRLRVAVDGRPLQANPSGGVARYMRGALSLLADDLDLYVVLDARLPAVDASIDGRAGLVELAAPVSAPGLVWLELAVAPWLRRFGGTFHGTFNVLPLAFRGRSVLTLHDLAPQLHSEDFRLSRRVAWRVNIRSAVRRASVVTTVSEFVRRQITEYFKLGPERILVAPGAVDPVFRADRQLEALELARTLAVEPPYIVALGGATRRGLPVAIEAWRRANARLRQAGQRAGQTSGIRLVVVGEPDLPSENGLVSVGSLDDGAWATLLAGAQALCYPTRYEGFGLPALEAAASGTPVVCAPLASLPEVLGEAGCWATEPSPDAIASVLVRLLSDSEWHTDRREAGLERARSAPTWAHTASVLAEAYERAAA